MSTINKFYSKSKNLVYSFMKFKIIILLLFTYFVCGNSIDTPKIFLKLDDLYVQNGKCLFIPVMDYLKQNEIKFSAGIIASACDNTSLRILWPYMTAIDSKGDRLLEIFNHGLDHTCTEFLGTTYEYQKSHLDKSTQIIKNYLGIQMHTFGAPCNANDSITNQVISDNPNYKVFFQNNIQDTIDKNILFLRWPDVQIENVQGNPNYDFFVKNYNSIIKYSQKYLILPCHPNTWTPAQLGQFKLIIDFLIKHKCEFDLPYEYYLGLNLNSSVNLNAEVLSPKQVELLWNNKDTSEYNYKVERSSDRYEWITIGVCPEKTTSYIDYDINSNASFYYYRLYAMNEIKSEYSNIVRADILNTGIYDKQNISNIEIYSITGTSKININLNLTKSGSVTSYIYNLNGTLVKALFSNQLSIGYYQFTFDVSEIKSGIYLCRFQTPFEYSAKKIIVMNN